MGAGTIAGILGITSAYFGGWVDLLGQRLVDVLQAFPGLILAMAIVAILQTFSIEVTIIAISIPALPAMIRVVRGQALSVTKTDYVLAGRTIGASHLRLIFRYIMPNSMAPWIIVVTGRLGSAITTEASLSFLGLGVPEPHPSWGRHAQRQRVGLCRACSAHHCVPRPRSQHGGVRVQCVWRRSARRAGSAAGEDADPWGRVDSNRTSITATKNDPGSTAGVIWC